MKKYIKQTIDFDFDTYIYNYDDIKKKFGNDTVLILGNWSMNKKGIKCTSIPNKKYEKVLNRNFITLKINEFRNPFTLSGFYNTYVL